jgi:phosphoglycolate phosphatase-like HAD superfamily hydrolase
MNHIVWDWNGTLLDDIGLVVEATNASLATAGGGPVTMADHRRDFRRPVHHYYGAVLGRDIDSEEFVKLDRAFHEAYDAGLATCELSPGALAALAGWSGTQSLLSMWFHDQLVPTVNRYGLTSYLGRVDGLRTTIGGGPKAPHLVAHLEALGLRGPECVLIGDSIDDAVAAASVGARCVLFSGGLTDRDRLATLGLPVVDTLAEAVLLAG